VGSTTTAHWRFELGIGGVLSGLARDLCAQSFIRALAAQHRPVKRRSQFLRTVDARLLEIEEEAYGASQRVVLVVGLGALGLHAVAQHGEHLVTLELVHLRVAGIFGSRVGCGLLLASG